MLEGSVGEILEAKISSISSKTSLKNIASDGSLEAMQQNLCLAELFQR